jgi:hypothetical protein
MALTELPGKGRVLAVLIAFGVSILGDVFAIVSSLVGLAYYVGKTPAQIAAEADEFTLPMMLGCCEAPFQFIIYIVTVVTFCMWIYRAHDNLRFLAVSGLEFTSGWAVGWFFIPIMNLFKPMQAAQEIYKASDPALPLSSPFGWKKATGSALIGTWWGLWIAFNVLSNVSMRLAFQSNPGREALLASEALSGVTATLSIAAAGCAMLMIRQIQDRQAKKYQVVVARA